MAKDTARRIFESPIEFLSTMYPKKDRDPKQLLGLEIALEDVDPDLLWEAAIRYSNHEEYFPSPSGLRKYVDQILAETEEEEILTGHERMVEQSLESGAFEEAYNRPLEEEEIDRLETALSGVLEGTGEDIPGVDLDPDYLGYMRRIGRVLSGLDDPAHHRYIDERIMSLEEYQAEIETVEEAEPMEAVPA